MNPLDPGPPPVTQAVDAIRAFAGERVNRYEASELLDLWRHRTQLDQGDVNAVLAQFPEPRPNGPAQ